MIDKDTGNFADYQPLPSTDGSYFGIKNHDAHREKYMQDEFENQFSQLKERLKAARCKAKVTKNNNSLALQATLPLKPGDKDKKGTGTKQYLISLGIPANLDGLKTAEEEAYELGKLIARKTFVWNDKYLGVKSKQKLKVKTFGELLEKFENEYFKNHKRTIKSEHSFNNYLRELKRRIPPEQLATSENLLEILDTTETESYPRRNLAISISVFAKYFDIDINITEYLKRPKAQKRNIPSDNQIETAYLGYEQYANNRQQRGIKNRKFENNWKIYRWVYGMLATFGLRPRELFLRPNIQWWLSTENIHNTWKVDELAKTGEREVLPLHERWIELFDLKNQEICLSVAEYFTDSISYKRLNSNKLANCNWFKKANCGFTPYDLRHAWAIRAHLMGIPIKAASDNLGHSVQMHTSTYQKWFSLDNRKSAIDTATAKQHTIKVLETKVKELELENEKLRITIKRLELEKQEIK